MRLKNELIDRSKLFYKLLNIINFNQNNYLKNIIKCTLEREGIQLRKDPKQTQISPHLVLSLVDSSLELKLC
jgi:hypothetical protein